MRSMTGFLLVALGVFGSDAFAQSTGAIGQGNLLNPEITVYLDLGGSVSTNQDNKAHNRFTLREAELDFRSAVAPIADAVVNIAVHEEVEDPFGDVEVTMNFELEEGYLNVHTLPYDFAAKGGKYRALFGRNNLLHTHDLPQITRPLPVLAFLGHEGLATVGGELSWLVPNPWDQFFEWTTSVVNADGGDESPLLRGPSARNPAVVSHLKWFGDVGGSSSLEFGSSLLYARATGGFDDTLLGGADATWTWRDPRAPDRRSVLVQGEFFVARADSPREDAAPLRRTTFGAYAFAQVQFHRKGYAGLRYDYTEIPNVAERRRNDDEWATSGWVTWYYSEALRFRFELQHLDREMAGERDSEQIAMLGVSFFIGAHPSHPYWVNR